MARIPQTSPGNTQLTTTTPSAQQTQTVGQGKGLEHLGGAVEKSADYLYQKMDEARDYTETAKGSLYVTEENNKLAIEMLQGTVIGPDGKPRRRTGTPEDIACYKQKQKQILETAKRFHTSKDGEMRASFAYEKDALVTENAIVNGWRKTHWKKGKRQGF